MGMTENHQEIQLLKKALERLEHRVILLEGSQDMLETYQMEQRERSES